jgi:hypothetical protein
MKLLPFAILLIMAGALAADDASLLRHHATLIFHDSCDREATGSGSNAISNDWNNATADRVPHVKTANLYTQVTT